MTTLISPKVLTCLNSLAVQINEHSDNLSAKLEDADKKITPILNRIAITSEDINYHRFIENDCEGSWYLEVVVKEENYKVALCLNSFPDDSSGGYVINHNAEEILEPMVSPEIYFPARTLTELSRRQRLLVASVLDDFMSGYLDAVDKHEQLIRQKIDSLKKN